MEWSEIGQRLGRTLRDVTRDGHMMPRVRAAEMDTMVDAMLAEFENNMNPGQVQLAYVLVQSAVDELASILRQNNIMLPRKQLIVFQEPN